MAQAKRGVTPEQLRELCKGLNLTVAAVAEGTGLSKAYISEFRNETRNLSASQQAQLRAYLDEQCAEAGIEFPEGDSDDAGRLVQGLGGMITRVMRPAILLSDDIPKAQADQLLNLIDANRVKVSAILAGEFKPGGLLGGDFSADTEQAIRDVFALLALNYVAILMLQGRSIVRKLPDDYVPQTMGDWLSQYLTNSPLAALLPADDEATELAEGVPA
jgi:transcriptional regulator with XRE-family HTH domain